MTPRFFFDTSALLKLYHEEAGTALLDGLLSEYQPIIVISDLSLVEMTSALAKKVRTQNINPETFQQVVATFERDALLFEIIDLNQDVKNRAVTLLKNYGIQHSLRTLDALQLASALSGSARVSIDKFIASDKTLINIAEKETLPVLLV